MRQKFVLRVKEKEAELKDAERELHSRDAMQQINFRQGWGVRAGAGRSRVFLAPWSRNRLKKKPGAGAAAA